MLCVCIYILQCGFCNLCCLYICGNNIFSSQRNQYFKSIFKTSLYLFYDLGRLPGFKLKFCIVEGNVRTFGTIPLHAIKNQSQESEIFYQELKARFIKSLTSVLWDFPMESSCGSWAETDSETLFFSTLYILPAISKLKLASLAIGRWTQEHTAWSHCNNHITCLQQSF